MKLSEVIAAVGDDNVKYQVLQQSFSGPQGQKNGHAQFSFATSAVSLADVLASEPKILGIIVWIPADKWKQALSTATNDFNQHRE